MTQADEKHGYIERHDRETNVFPYNWMTRYTRRGRLLRKSWLIQVLHIQILPSPDLELRQISLSQELQIPKVITYWFDFSVTHTHTSSSLQYCCMMSSGSVFYDARSYFFAISSSSNISWINLVWRTRWRLFAEGQNNGTHSGATLMEKKPWAKYVVQSEPLWKNRQNVAFMRLQETRILVWMISFNSSWSAVDRKAGEGW